MRRVSRFAICLFTLVLALPGCGGDDEGDDGPAGPGGGQPPSEMIGTWTYQSVTVDGAPASLAVVQDWEPGAAGSEVAVQANGAFVYQEINGVGAQLWFESGFFFIDGSELDINIQQNSDGSASEMRRFAWSIASGVMTLTSVGTPQSVVFTLTM